MISILTFLSSKHEVSKCKLNFKNGLSSISVETKLLEPRTKTFN